MSGLGLMKPNKLKFNARLSQKVWAKVLGISKTEISEQGHFIFSLFSLNVAKVLILISFIQGKTK